MQKQFLALFLVCILILTGTVPAFAEKGVTVGRKAEGLEKVSGRTETEEAGEGAEEAPMAAPLAEGAAASEGNEPVDFVHNVDRAQEPETIASEASEATAGEASEAMAGDGEAVAALQGDLAAGEACKLDADFLPLYSGGSFRMVFNKTRGGLYFLSRNTLKYIDLATGNGQEILVTNGKPFFFGEAAFYYLDNLTARAIELATGEELPPVQLQVDWGSSVYRQAIGADPQGRLYVATYERRQLEEANENGETYEEVNTIHLFSADGTELSSVDAGDRTVYCFNGFDNEGNFYFEGCYNWIYWGYDHDGHGVFKGKVTDNNLSLIELGNGVTVSGVLQYDLGCIEYICQNYYREHELGAELVGGRYLVTTSVTYGRMQVIDNAENSLLMRLAKPSGEACNYSYDLGSVGTRAAYNAEHDSLLVYDDSLRLVEYDLANGGELGSYTPANPLFCIAQDGEELYLLERTDEGFVLEKITWKEPEALTLTGEDSMKVGETQRLSLDSGRVYDLGAEWESSDPEVATVTQDGKVSAWKAGPATVTASILGGKLQASFTITVAEGSATILGAYVTAREAVDTANYSRNNVNRDAIVRSYLYENADGSLTRVEYLEEGSILVEDMGEDGSLRESKSVEKELDYFGGFFAGKQYNFLVFGQSNPEQSDEVEVVRVVRYGKDWTRQESLSIKGANTLYPFNAGSLRMTEAAGKLYIHTCHTMYTSSDGLNHQANMTFVVDEAAMTLVDGYHDVMNISQAGYVSHSFSQYVTTDGTFVYRADLGDAYPRAVAVTRCNVEGEVTNVRYNYALPIPGTIGANATGVTIGGLSLGADTVLVTGNAVDVGDEENYSAYGKRNIYLSVLDRDLKVLARKWLTAYDAESTTSVGRPQLVKINDYQFLLLWEETESETGKVVVKAQLLDEEGNLAGSAFSLNARLSDCQPIVSYEGLVTWYVTTGSRFYLYSLNPFRLFDSVLTLDITRDIAMCKVTFNPSYYSYDGTEKRPSVTVERYGETLTEGVDYEVLGYANNVKAGTATVKLRGLGAYYGTFDAPFTIYKAYQYIQTALVSGDVELGATIDLAPSGYENPVFTYKSSDESVAVVDANGTLHALAEGSATITIYAAETENYGSRSLTRNIVVTRDVHTMVEADVIFADEESNVATVHRICSVCGEEETVQFTTMDSFYLWYWNGNAGYSGISKKQVEGFEAGMLQMEAEVLKDVLVLFYIF